MRESFTTARCDRCGFETDLRLPSDEKGWGSIALRRSGDADGIAHSNGDPFDVCPGCGDAARAWWLDKAPVTQPTFEEMPVVRQRPAFGVEERQIVARATREALSRIASAVFSTIKADPTLLERDGIFELDGQEDALVEQIMALGNGGRT